MTKYLTLAFLAVAAFGQQSKFDYPTQIKNGPLVSDAGASTFAVACARGASGATVSVTKAWLAVPAQSCSANLAFNGGSIQPASAAVVTLTGAVTAAAVKIFDYSAGGTVVLTGAKAGLVFPQWWGVVGDGATDNAVHYARALAGSLTLFFGAGTYNSSLPLTVLRSGTTITCNSRSDTTLNFTGATDGVVISNTALYFADIGRCKILGANAAGLKGVSVNTPANSTNVNIHDNFITTTEGGRWTYGIWTSGVQTGVLARNWIQNHVTIAGITLTADSNATKIEDNLIGAIESNADGIQVQTSGDVILSGGVIQGASYTRMLWVDSDASVFVYGTYFENGGAGTPAVGIESSGGLVASGVWFGGGSYTYGIKQGTIGFAYVSGLRFGGSATVAAVSFNDAVQNVLRDSFIVNANTGSNGVDSRYGQGNTIVNNYIAATGAGNAILVTDNGEATVISGNRLYSDTGYGIYSDSGGSGYTFSFDHNDFFTNVGFECNGTRTTVGSARANYSHYGGGEMGDIAPGVTFARLATISPVMNGSTVFCTNCKNIGVDGVAAGSVAVTAGTGAMVLYNANSLAWRVVGP